MQPMQNGDNLVKWHERQHYYTLFNKRTGFFARKEEDGYPEPFWSEDGPELLDVSITNYCERGCTFCYRQSNRKGKHISFCDLEKIVDEAKQCGVLQIALGGGNPNQHPQFIEILQCIRENGIVPSYTSNGDGLNDEILQATKMFCGAMAISLYPPYDIFEALTTRILSYGIKLNLHAILKSDTIDILTKWLNEPPSWFSNINALIVLNYKPIASGADFIVKDRQKLQEFYQTVKSCNSVRIGFDSCCVPGIVTWMNSDPMLIESCEAARFSAFISEDLKMYPCSFMAGTSQYGDLRKNKLLDIWQNNEAFVRQREAIYAASKCGSCQICPHLSLCNGGCRFMPIINQCNYQ